MFELLNYEFMQRAFAAGLLVAVICPLIGTFVVMRRLSRMPSNIADTPLPVPFPHFFHPPLFTLVPSTGIETQNKNVSAMFQYEKRKFL